MSRMATALRNDVQALQLMRDELQLHLHLLRADARDRWTQLEQQWERLREHVGRAQTAADDARPEIEAAAGLLVDSLRRGYADIEKAMKS